MPTTTTTTSSINIIINIVVEKVGYYYFSSSSSLSSLPLFFLSSHHYWRGYATTGGHGIHEANKGLRESSVCLIGAAKNATGQIKGAHGGYENGAAQGWTGRQRYVEHGVGEHKAYEGVRVKSSS